MSDDAELLRRYAETRSEPAFATLVERHLGLVYAAALRRLEGDTHRATEVAQTVFIALARQAPTLAHRPVLASWLHTATRHAALDLRRSEHRQRTRDHQFLVTGTVNAPAPSDAPADWEKLRPLLDAALDQFNESDRALLLLRFFEQHAFTDIGAKLHLTEDAARMRTARALEKLRAHLARHGITSTATALGAALTTQTLTAAPAGLATAITTGALAGTAALTALSLTVMTATTKILLATVTLIAALAIGAAIYEARRADHSDQAFADLQKERDSLTHQNTSLRSNLAASSTELARAVAQQRETATQLAHASTTSTPPNTPIRSMWSYPGAGSIYVAKQRVTLGLRYGQLYRELELSPEQIAKFEKAQIELQQGLVDIWTEASARGLNTGDSSVARLTTEPHLILQTNLTALLGEEGYKNYQRYDKDRATRDLVTSLAGNSYYAEPLSLAQGKALVGILKANTDAKRIPMKDEGKNTIYTVRNETNWEAVASQAQGVLSETQLATLKQLSEQQRLDAEMIELQNPRKQPRQ